MNVPARLRSASVVPEPLELVGELRGGRGIREGDAHAARTQVACPCVIEPVLPVYPALDRVQQIPTWDAKANPEQRAERQGLLGFDEEPARTQRGRVLAAGRAVGLEVHQHAHESAPEAPLTARLRVVAAH